MTDIEPYSGVVARANWGRWVADCATPHCTNAWQIDVAQVGWVCNTCGRHNLITWPPDPAAVEYLLMQRPDPITRNWAPGETLQDLLNENVLHGIMPMVEFADSDFTVMVTVDELVVDGAILPGVEEIRGRLAVSGAHHMIGAL